MSTPLPDFQSVEEANLHYCQAVEALSLQDLEEIWLPSDDCRCVLPGWPLLRGWLAIRRSWEEIFSRTRELEVNVDQVAVQIDADRAWLNCRERVLRVTEAQGLESWLHVSNLFSKHQGRWRLLQHHAAPLADRTRVRRWLQ